MGRLRRRFDALRTLRDRAADRRHAYAAARSTVGTRAMKPIADAGCRRVLLGLGRARRPHPAVATSLVEVDPDRCCLRRCHGVEDRVAGDRSQRAGEFEAKCIRRRAGRHRAVTRPLSRIRQSRSPRRNTRQCASIWPEVSWPPRRSRSVLPLRSAIDITGAGATFPVSDLRQVGGSLQAEDGCRHELPVDRLRRRHRADQGEDRRLRRVRHAAQARGPAGRGSRCSFPAIIGGVVPGREHRRRRAGRDRSSPAPCSPTSISARSRSGTKRRSPTSIRASSCRTS